MKSYDYIGIIFNPKSTGNAKQSAEALSRALSAHKSLPKAVLHPTKRAGHAMQLTGEIIAQKHKKPLIISVSGDGGYNEVINGVMRAADDGADSPAVVAVYAAGNANDHKNSMRGDTSLVKQIVKGKTQPMDLLRLEASSGDFSLIRYAHSYIGFGASAHIGDLLNRHGKTRFHEIWAVFHGIRTMEPFYMQYRGKKRAYDSVIFANVDRMAKYLTLSTNTSPSDGSFEIITTLHQGPHMIKQLWHAVTHGLTRTRSVRSIKTSIREASVVQLDGEVESFPKTGDVALTITTSTIETVC